MTTTQHPIIDQLEQRIADECGSVDLAQRYDDMLDECYSFKSVGGIFAHMSPSRVLKECDPVAYRCGMVDFEDGENLVEIGGSYYEQNDAENVRDAMVSELEDEVAELEAEEVQDAAAIVAKLASIKALNHWTP